MGGIYEEMQLPYMPANRVREKWPGIVSESRWENGHGGYSGSFAEKPEIEIYDGPHFKTDDEARDYIQDHNDKWGPATAAWVEGPEPEGHWYIGGWCSS